MSVFEKRIEFPILKAGILRDVIKRYTVANEIPKKTFNSFGERNCLSDKFFEIDQFVISLSRIDTE